MVAGYSLLGACWLNWKTDGETQNHARRLMRILAPVTLGAIAAVSVATLFLGGEYIERWFAMPAVLVTAQVPLIIAILTWRFVRSLRRNYELAPFVITLAVFGLSFVGLGISMYPYLIPNSITLQMAAAPPSSQAFMLVGAARAGAADPARTPRGRTGCSAARSRTRDTIESAQEASRRSAAARGDSAGWPSSGP